MSRRELRKKIEELRKASEAFGRGAQERAIRERLRMAILDEECNLTTPRFQKAKDPKDRVLEPEAEELWGENYTGEQVQGEAASRVLDNFDEYMATPAGNTGDLTPYTEDLDYYERERFCEQAVRQLETMASQIKREKGIRGGR